MSNHQNMDSMYQLIQKDIEHMAKQMTDLKGEIHALRLQNDEAIKELKKEYVKKLEFAPVQKLVYGMVTLILTGVVSALMGLILIK